MYAVMIKIWSNYHIIFIIFIKISFWSFLNLILELKFENIINIIQKHNGHYLINNKLINY